MSYKVGDKVIWRGSFGNGFPTMATIKGIGLVTNGDKEDTEPVNEIADDQMRGRDVVVDLTNGHWAWGNQISKL
jgi:hypothetical protein